MTRLVIRTYNYHIVFEGSRGDVAKRILHSVFPNFKHMEKQDIIDISCNKLNEVRVLWCMYFIVMCKEDFTNVKFNKSVYMSIKREMDSVDNKGLAYDILIILQYFGGNVVDEIVAFLYYMCILRGIEVDDEMVKTYVRNKIRSIWIDIDYEKETVHKLYREHMIYTIIKINEKWDAKLERECNKMLCCDEDGVVRFTYYPKDLYCDIICIKELDANREYIGVTYKHKFNNTEVLVQNERYSIIDENKRWIDTSRDTSRDTWRKVRLDGNSRAKGYILYIPTGCTIEIQWGMIVYKLYENSMLKGVSMIPGDIMYRSLFCPTIEDVCVVFREIVLKRK